MKHFIRIAVLVGLLGVVPPVLADEATATFTVEKMDCAMCPITVSKAMENVDGVIKAKVDYDTKTATVTYNDDETNLEEIANASTEIGYPARPNEG